MDVEIFFFLENPMQKFWITKNIKEFVKFWLKIYLIFGIEKLNHVKCVSLLLFIATKNAFKKCENVYNLFQKKNYIQM